MSESTRRVVNMGMNLRKHLRTGKNAYRKKGSHYASTSIYKQRVHLRLPIRENRNKNSRRRQELDGGLSEDKPSIHLRKCGYHNLRKDHEQDQN